MSSHDTKSPIGGVNMGHVMESTNPDDHLLERILSKENMRKAWKRVKVNKGSPGIDKMSIEEFPEFARNQWNNIRESIFAGTYQPFPVRRVEIPKATGGTRPLGIPTVLDRLIQQAIYQVLRPIFDPGFSDYSYGFRPGRSAHDAVYQIREYILEGCRIAVDMDLSKFFDTVNHDVLMHRVARKIRDKRVLKLIGKYLRAGVMVNGRLQATRKGVPQGGPLSPLLANILLDDLDKELERRDHRFVRYADDFIILVKSQRAGERVMLSVQRFLERKLKLKVNLDKSQVAPTDKTDFLGFTFKGTKIRWSDKAFREFKRRVKRLTGRSWFVSMEYRFEKLAQYLRGWMNYFGISEYYRPIPEIDHWLRRRIRMCYWKQWRRFKTRVRNLHKIGTHPGVAIPMCFSRKGPWKCARTLATQTGMTNQWLKDQGLLSVKELWVNIHYPATAR
ncbi:MAG: group II intron reverse transcriptase/maturase [Thermodesulfobacteriota bacterium]|nr:group II intron reverse transcriptase/maturase [Thermodesulfobacteriota bacterium]